MKVGITFVPFEYLTANYVAMLEEAKRKCDYMIVGLNANPKRERLIAQGEGTTLVERYIQLAGCKYVDEIVPFEDDEDIEDIIKAFDVDVRFVRDEKRGKNYVAKNYCLTKGIEGFYVKNLGVDKVLLNIHREE